MKEATERLTITITDIGVIIHCEGEEALALSASEALMFLDILKNEESRLQEMAQKNSVAPFRIKI